MNTRLYDFASGTIRLIMRTLWRARATGTENVPMDGPLIVACNHVSYLDPPGMGCFCPRRISFMAKKELFAIPVLGPGIAAVGAYPVDRHGSATAAIKRSLEVLQAGGCVGIFPEGTRNLTGEVVPQAGAALLASLAKAPVVPACIVGSDRAREFPAIKVAFGPPLRLPQGRKATRDDLAKFAAEIMSAIRALAESNAN
ncbi:MAG TPA: lysophospholipid acyltransferase family protein [Verrucomicrobiae bacterium]|nr:lysophospholipid acyltransferase family protein [Verrucomicrobiae bacterium]